MEDKEIKNKEKVLIMKVRENKYSKQKLVSIPKECEHLKKGDYVRITKVG
jgi:hypothetical protein